jgi:hypothetical protein
VYSTYATAAVRIPTVNDQSRSASFAELTAALAPETPLETFQCRCGRIFDIRASHIQGAA